MTRFKPSNTLIRLVVATSFATLAACGLSNAAEKTFVVPAPTVDVPLAPAKGSETLVLAGGCFWGVDAVFKHVKGVDTVVSGYSGGDKSTASYEVVSTGQTGHAESVSITYDPSQVTVGQLLKVFFSVAHNPTELNRQGPDTGTQYRSAIFYKGDDQKRVAEAYVAQMNTAKTYPAAIVTQITPLKAFYPAEAYHQNYLKLHPYQPYIVINDAPKLVALKQMFPDLYKEI